MTDKIAQSLGLPVPVKANTEVEIITPSEVAETGKAEEDFNTARQNLLSTIETTNESIKDLIDLAQQSQHPKVYEALSGFLKTNIEANRELLKLHKEIRDLQKQDGSAPQQQGTTNIQNNNLFVGTTADLMKLLKDDSNN